MTLEPLEPKKIQTMRAIDLTSASLDNVLVRDTHEDGHPWKRVRSVRAKHIPVDGAWLDEANLIFEDGSELLYNYDDTLEIGIL